jgi:rod shape-determining protein MreC
VGSAAIKPLFVKGPSIGSRLLVLSVLSLVLIVAGQRYQWLELVEAKASVIAAPFYWAADAPAQLLRWGSDNTQSRSYLLKENAKMRS